MTWSITARCADTGELGVAVSTCVPGVGGLCPYVQAGAGAISTQSFVNPYIGIRGLTMLAEGQSAEDTKAGVLVFDPHPELRQFAIVDAAGGVAAYSGDSCDGWYGHTIGDGFVVAGNMLISADTISASADYFHTSRGALAERLLGALQAGQDAGGDKRGRQSAALKVCSIEEYALVDLRVDEHPDPVPELRRVYTVAAEQLFPFMTMLPTKSNPGGSFDPDASREMGILHD